MDIMQTWGAGREEIRAYMALRDDATKLGVWMNSILPCVRCRRESFEWLSRKPLMAFIFLH